MTDKYQRWLPLGISIGIHLVVLIIMMLYFIPLMKEEPWYEISWADVPPAELEPQPEPSAETDDIQVSIAQPQSPSRPQAQKAPPVTQTRPNPSPAIPKAPASGIPRPSESDIVEAPTFSDTVQPFRPPTGLKSNPVASDALRETVTGPVGPSGSGSVDSEIEGGKLVRTDTKKRTHSFGDYGEVKLKFRVDVLALVDETSIQVVQTQNNRVDAEAIKILKDMSFSFRGKPDADRYYVITIKFNP